MTSVPDAARPTSKASTSSKASSTAKASSSAKASSGSLENLPWRRIGIALGIWAALAGLAIGIAAALNDEPQRPASQQAAAAPAAKPSLPPLRLYVERPLPASVARLSSAAQARSLAALTRSGPTAARYVDLGTVHQELRNTAAARTDYQRALALQPGSLEAEVGLAMADGATGAAGLKRAAARLAALERANPNNQLVAFNEGMLAIYRGDGPAVQRNLVRAAKLNSATRLGQGAAQLLRALVAGNP